MSGESGGESRKRSSCAETASQVEGWRYFRGREKAFIAADQHNLADEMFQIEASVLSCVCVCVSNVHEIKSCQSRGIAQSRGTPSGLSGL